MIEIDINCDVGEGLGNEESLMPLISSCNIACGGHAGDGETIAKVVDSASKSGVKIGAHPSYPDRKNFGRISMKIDKSDLVKSIREQMSDFQSVLNQKNLSIHHIKAHGALYNDIAKDVKLANTFLEGLEGYQASAAIFVPFGSAIAKEAQKKGFEIIREAFIDRHYNFDLSLVSRNLQNAVITDPKSVMAHLLPMVKEGCTVTMAGKRIYMEAETFCIHGDTPNALEILTYLSKELREHNIKIKK